MECLPWGLYWYNTMFQGAAKCTPFEIVYSRAPPSIAIARFIPRETITEAVAQDLMASDEALKQLKFHLSRAQGHMSKFADSHKESSVIKKGDWVYLKIRPHKQVPMPKRIHPKLSAYYHGPFFVIK